MLREIVDEKEGKVGFKASGVAGEILEERIGGMLDDRGKEARWALPESSGEHRESVNPGRWRWKREEGK